MKLCTFQLADASSPRLGLLQDDQVVDVAIHLEAQDGMAPPWSQGMLALLESDGAAWRRLEQLMVETVPEANRLVEEVQLLAPLPRPRSVRDCLSFERHWIQCARTVAGWKAPPLAWLDRALERLTGWSLLRPPSVWRQRPIYYKGNPASIVGTDHDVIWPSYSQRLDFELEIAVYIGKTGVNIPVEGALQHVAGFSLFNDFSARDVQFREMRGRLGPAKSKDFDTGNALGPCLVTPDEVDLSTMTLAVHVNDTLWSESKADSLYHDVASTLSFISQSETLYPGDIIGLGTVPNGCGLELNRWIQPGDRIALSATGLGRLVNHVRTCDALH